VQYALMWYITLKTKSGTMMAIYIVCGFVPTFFLAPFAGVWADRYDRKKLIMLSDGMIALATLGLALLFMAGRDALWLMFMTAAVRSVGTALQQPAVGAFLPQLVPGEQLTRVNGINGGMQAAIMLVSPMLGGVLIAFAPMQAVFLVDVATAILAIATLALFLPVPPHAKAQAKQENTYFADLKLGFRFIRGHRYLLSFFAYLAVLLFLVAPAAFLTPLQVTRTFGADVWRLTAIEIVFSVGMMAGGALIAAWGGFANRIHTMLLAHVVMAICTVALGVVPMFWLYLVAMGIFGISMPFFNTPSTVLIQEHVEEAFMGRVFGVMTMIFTSVMPLAMLLFGPLAERIRIEWMLLGTGALQIACWKPGTSPRPHPRRETPMPLTPSLDPLESPHSHGTPR
jgi:DHA3 family macrolide efflux protein-like MFS transporter